MSVLTSGQFFKKQESGSTVYSTNKSVPTKKISTKDIQYRYRFEPAPMGESTAFTVYNDKEVKIKLVNGIFDIPMDWSITKKDLYVKMFKALNWMDVSVQSEDRKEKIKKLKQPMIYFAGHPDNTRDMMISGNLTITIGKKEIQLACKEGMITTDNKLIYQALLKQGFYEVKQPIVKETK